MSIKPYKLIFGFDENTKYNVRTTTPTRTVDKIMQEGKMRLRLQEGKIFPRWRRDPDIDTGMHGRIDTPKITVTFLMSEPN